MIAMPLAADGVEAVVAIEDPILRNLWITQSYFDLSTRLQHAVGGVDRTWCGFAVWASDTAGQSIRGQELPHDIVLKAAAEEPAQHQADVESVNRRILPLRAVKASQPLTDDPLQDAVQAALNDVSTHIAHGNTLVYEELAPLLVAFVERCEAGHVPSMSADEVQALLTTAAGGPLDDDLGQAFEWWRRAVVTTDERSRAFAVLAANVLAVAHEQQRLQPDIAAAMDTGVLTAARLISHLTPSWMPHVIDRIVATIVGEPLQRLATRLGQELTTELLMTLRVPGAVLRLRDDIPPLDGQVFPEVLGELADSPEEIALAVQVFRRWDRTDGAGSPVGARNWSVLTERMNFIVNLFRGRQRDPALAASPFTDDQLAAMREGRVPDGSLLPPLAPR